MTDLETLYACRNIWAWLAITGSSEKDTYTPAKEYPFYCPCCKHAGAFFIRKGGKEDLIDNWNRDCRKCLLNGYAWKVSKIPNHVACENDYNSFYINWCDAENELDKSIRQYWAMRMVQACDRAIEDILLNLN